MLLVQVSSRSLPSLLFVHLLHTSGATVFPASRSRLEFPASLKADDTFGSSAQKMSMMERRPSALVSASLVLFWLLENERNWKTMLFPTSLYESSTRFESSNSWRSDPSLFSRSLSDLLMWSRLLAERKPGCVRRLICEGHRMVQQHSGLLYFILSLFTNSFSFIVAENFGDVINANSLTDAATEGRMTHNCRRFTCQAML